MTVCAAALLCTSAANADELHLRDGTVIIGAYVGGTQKEIYFQHTPAGSDLYPVFMVEAVKFNPVPTFAPSAALEDHGTKSNATRPASVTETWGARLKWIFTLLLRPQAAAQ